MIEFVAPNCPAKAQQALSEEKGNRSGPELIGPKKAARAS
jgi:hypothetical protein